MTTTTERIQFPIGIYGKSSSECYYSSDEMVRLRSLIPFLVGQSLVDANGKNYKITGYRRVGGIAGFFRDLILFPNVLIRSHFHLDLTDDGSLTPDEIRAIILRLASRNETFGPDDVERLRSALETGEHSSFAEMYSIYRQCQKECKPSD